MTERPFGPLQRRVRTMMCVVGLQVALIACSVPVREAPPRGLIEPVQAGAVDASVAWPQARWWADWGSKELESLIDQALTQSPNVGIAQARAKQAQSAADTVAAGTSPRLSFNADVGATRYSEYSIYPRQIAGTTQVNASAQFAGSWELDLFGRQRASVQAALGERNAARADEQAARVLIATQVAQHYVSLARLGELLTLSEDAVRQRAASLELVSQRVQAGLDTRVEQRQAESVLAQARTEQQRIREAVARQRHALAEWSGQGPNALGDLLPPLFAVRGEGLPSSLPADLIGRRADLVAQRLRVESTQAGVEAARAQFYPNVNLVAFAGLSSLGLDRFLDLGSRTYGVGPAVRLPIFDGGALKANLAGRQADVELAIEAYNVTLLRALREVADEVSSLQSIRLQRQSQAEALAAAQAAYTLALQRYRAGLGNYLMVLTVESDVIAQRTAQTELKTRELMAEFGLVRALGGGYREEIR